MSYSFNTVIFTSLSLTPLGCNKYIYKIFISLKSLVYLVAISYLPRGRISADTNRIIHEKSKSHTHNLGTCHLKHHW